MKKIEKNWKKNISLYLIGKALTIFGSSLVQFAIIWYITLETQSGIQMMVATLCGFIPQILVTLFAGVWADRYSKKMLIILSDSAIAIATSIIAILFILGMDYLWLLYIALIIRSFGAGVQAPTATAFIPELVPKEKLMRVNGISTTIQSIMLVFSPAAAGVLLSMFSLGPIMFVDLITAIIGLSFIAFVKHQHKRKDNGEEKVFNEIKEGIIYTKGNILIRKLIKYSIIFNILITPLAVLTPLFVTRVFGAEAWRLSVGEISFFVGSIVGGVLIATWGGYKRRVKTISLGCILCGLFSIGLGLAPNFAIYLIISGILGITLPIFNTPALTLMQENIEPEMYGRTFSLMQLIGGAVMPLAMIVFGPLADIVSIKYIFIVGGILFAYVGYILSKDKVVNKL